MAGGNRSTDARHLTLLSPLPSEAEERTADEQAWTMIASAAEHALRTVGGMSPAGRSEMRSMYHAARRAAGLPRMTSQEADR